MNIQAYITSGILELYVLGLATEEEVKEVEKMASQHPEVQQEIDSLRQAMQAYAVGHRVQPPPDLKDKIIQQIERSPKPATHKPASHSDRGDASPQTSIGAAKRSGGGGVLAFILAIALIGAGVAVWHFYNEATSTGQELQQLQAQFDQYKKECEEKQQQSNLLQEQFIAIRHWSTKAVPMRGTPLSSESFAVVYWNNVKRTSFIDVVNLPEPPPGKQYQLWAIVDGKPTDMGVFELKSETGAMQPVPFIENPQAFAVTLENEGGSPTPSLNQMYVMGNVGKS